MSIKVPEGMLKAALDTTFVFTRETMARAMLEAALRWLRENPIVPTDEQVRKMVEIGSSDTHTSVTALCMEWQRRMFLEPEEKIPSDVMSLLQRHQMPFSSRDQFFVKLCTEAYRLGQKSTRG